MRRSPVAAFAGIFVVTLLSLIAVGAVLPVLPRYVRGRSTGNVAVGVVVGCFAFTGLAARPFAGQFADHRGRRPDGGPRVAARRRGGRAVPRSGGLPGRSSPAWCSAWARAPSSPPAPRGSSTSPRPGGGPGDRPLRACGLERAQHRALDRRAALPRVRLPPRVGVRGRGPVTRRAGRAAHPGPVPSPRARPAARPLIARESLRPGAGAVTRQRRLRGDGRLHRPPPPGERDSHGAIAFTVFAATVVITRLLAGDLPDRVGPLRCAAGAAAVESLGLVLIALARTCRWPSSGRSRWAPRSRPSTRRSARRRESESPRRAAGGPRHLYRVLRPRSRARRAAHRRRRGAGRLLGGVLARRRLRRRRRGGVSTPSEEPMARLLRPAPVPGPPS